LEKLKASAEALAIHARANNSAGQSPESNAKALFEQRVKENGSAPAVVWQGEMLSYEEINQLANGLAERLRCMKIVPGDTVGVCAERSVELIIALLAIVKCGAAYLPFDAAWPAETLIGVLKDAHCNLVLARTTQNLHGRIPGCRVVEISRQELVARSANPAIIVSGDDIAYINFTSGTTGVPKGVQIRHRSISNLVMNPFYANLGAYSIVLQLSPATFDAATFEIWGPLLNGGCCALYPSRIVRFSELKRFIERWRVNCLFLTTALFNAVLDEAGDSLTSVEIILFGGEAYSDKHVRRALAQYGTGRCVHVYGPTECTTFATYYQVDRMPTEMAELPIGRPIQNTRLYIVNDGSLCGPGQVGEILLGGPGLSAGYLNDVVANRARFGELEIDGGFERIYRTGDCGYLLESGDVVFRGRLDDQVKVNGFRIELSRISRVIGEHPDVKQSYVTVSDGVAGERMLLAFIVPQHRECDPRQIRESLRRRLPSYMVPAIIYSCGRLPLLTTGKVDRRSLLAKYVSVA
jgi:D-alanine--poly(phosphoribitol) ligase subunit 1